MLAPRIPYSTLRVNTVKGKPRTWFALVLATSLFEIGFRILCLKGSLGGFLEKKFVVSAVLETIATFKTQQMIHYIAQR